MKSTNQPFCKLCNGFGHYAAECSNKQKQSTEPIVSALLPSVVLQRSVTGKTRQERWKDAHAEKFKEHRRKYMRKYRKSKSL